MERIRLLEAALRDLVDQLAPWTDWEGCSRETDAVLVAVRGAEDLLRDSERGVDRHPWMTRMVGMEDGDWESFPAKSRVEAAEQYLLHRAENEPGFVPGAGHVFDVEVRSEPNPNWPSEVVELESDVWWRFTASHEADDQTVRDHEGGEGP